MPFSNESIVHSNYGMHQGISDLNHWQPKFLIQIIILMDWIIYYICTIGLHALYIRWPFDIIAFVLAQLTSRPTRGNNKLHNTSRSFCTSSPPLQIQPWGSQQLPVKCQLWSVIALCWSAILPQISRWWARDELHGCPPWLMVRAWVPMNWKNV